MRHDLKITIAVNILLIVCYVLEIQPAWISPHILEFVLIGCLLTTVPPYLVAANNPNYNIAYHKWQIAEYILWFIVGITLFHWGIESLKPNSYPSDYYEVAGETLIAVLAATTARHFKNSYFIQKRA
jgi:peptidoglycan/LPS O-acetylase OafA/YrhL